MSAASDWTVIREALTKHGALPTGTTFQWLIERGQPERQTPTVWLEHTGWHPATEKRWTETARDGAMFPSKEAAEQYISEHFTHPTRGASCRAVEHGFMSGDPIVESALDALSARLAALEDALFECFVHAGADTDGARTLSDMGQIAPGIDVLAVRAVKELRAEYDEPCDCAGAVEGAAVPLSVEAERKT